MTVGIPDEDMTRAQIRAALHDLQAGRCAICGTDGKLHLDHDHATGLARGLLCRSCNNREGKSDAPDIQTYLANPPAAGRNWLWKLPDAWTVVDTEAARQAGMTILEYMPHHLKAAAEREAILEQNLIAMGRNRAPWNPDEETSLPARGRCCPHPTG